MLLFKLWLSVLNHLLMNLHTILPWTRRHCTSTRSHSLTTARRESNSGQARIHETDRRRFRAPTQGRIDWSPSQRVRGSNAALDGVEAGPQQNVPIRQQIEQELQQLRRDQNDFYLMTEELRNEPICVPRRFGRGAIHHKDECLCAAPSVAQSELTTPTNVQS